MYVDSHCHLDFPEFEQRFDDVIERMAANQVSAAVCICVTLPDLPRVLAVAERRPTLYATVGVHPDYEGTVEPTLDALLVEATHPKVIAIGETGLDYYRLRGDLEWQRDRFRTHIQAARAASLPLVVHTRAAAADTIRILREEGAEAVGGVMHCFTETWDTARAALDLGFMISFSGILTFKNAEELRDIARRVPLDRMLIETDSPYLAPVPHRGKTNEPSFVRHVAEKLAELRELPPERVGEITTNNFRSLFRVLQ
jgi:TatD DNase family protein